MQTLKTAVVVVLLMVVLYGAYVAINTPDPIMPGEIQMLTESGDSLDLEIDLDVPELDMPPGADTFGATEPASVAANTPPQANPAMQGIDLDPAISAPEPIGMTRLPQPEGESPEIAIDSEVEYPRTPHADVAQSAWSTEPAGDSQPKATDAAAATGQGVEMSISDTADPAATDSAATDPISLPQEAAPVEASIPADGAGLANAIETADEQVSEGRLRDALFTLSVFFGSPELTEEQNEQLLDRLDVLAREVIYSRRHLIEQPYRVRHGESLQQIAADFNVPWQLLARINDVTRPDALPAGTELKVIRGPFRAEVGLNSKSLTLFLGDLYAGQFPVELGEAASLSEGSYSIREKSAGGEGNNSGSVYLDLGNQVAIHGSAAGPAGTSIQLQPNDARDVQGILSQGSPVTIRR